MINFKNLWSFLVQIVLILNVLVILFLYFFKGEQPTPAAILFTILLSTQQEAKNIIDKIDGK